MFACHQKQVAEALLLQGPRFPNHLIHRESYAEDRIIPGKPTVFAIVNALVGKIKGREEANDFAKALSSDDLGSLAKLFQVFTRAWRNQSRKVCQAEVRFVQQGRDVRCRTQAG